MVAILWAGGRKASEAYTGPIQKNELFKPKKRATPSWSVDHRPSILRQSVIDFTIINPKGINIKITNILISGNLW